MTPRDWAGVVWLIGSRALRLHVSGDREVPPVAPHATSPAQSSLAAESAAMLVDARGGDALERAEFARLFAIGEPQKGLRAFLDRRKGMSVAEKT